MNNNTFIHKYLKPILSKEDTVVDMTAGNGNDTLFLARYAGKVIAFDICETAILRSKERTKDFDNVLYYQANHADVDRYVKKNEASLFLFNLGYLPGNEELSITHPNDTLTAFSKAYDLLIEGGYLVITFYLKQRGGWDEYYLITDYVQKKKLPVMEAYRQDKMDAPITWILHKIS